ncbi:hypothetical protein EVAR_65861_1 [Eumeta japonica]|uniref:Uncharacterized protein n=1 Tax=Eumeta variegata TaxID=151549 RepID=A0A4C1ZJ80_EUMVA|nr:hypothetical protein EVAR_65861_1 [Eumeta japonica]
MLFPIWLQQENGPARLVKYHSFTESRREVTVSAVVFFQGVRVPVFHSLSITPFPFPQPSSLFPDILFPRDRQSTHDFTGVVCSWAVVITCFSMVCDKQAFVLDLL